jgi:hypothetical protein
MGGGMLYLSKTIFLYWFCRILLVGPTAEVNAESVGAPSVKEIASAITISALFPENKKNTSDKIGISGK